jgi:hypothetical protein
LFPAEAAVAVPVCASPISSPSSVSSKRFRAHDIWDRAYDDGLKRGGASPDEELMAIGGDAALED